MIHLTLNSEASMRSPTMLVRVLFVVATLSAPLASCGDTGVATRSVGPAQRELGNGAVKFWEQGASVSWNAVAITLLDKYRPSQQAGLRELAYLSLAQYQAVIAAEDGATRSTHPSELGAVAGASAAVLAWAFPVEAAALDALVADAASRPEWPGAAHTDFEAGVQIGRQIGAAVVASAATDGFTSAQVTVPVCDACWHSLANPPAPPVFPRLGEMRPFFLTSGHQFRPGPPPAPGSVGFQTALAVVRQFSDTRTAFQDSLAKFWAAPKGHAVVQSYADEVAAGLITEFRLTERAAAHALALMNMAAMDAMIASHDAKYTYWLLRPSQADPLIKPDIPVPNHPSYPSNHACVTGSSMAILAALFPSRANYVNGLAEQAAQSRIYAGIHYPFDKTVGLSLGGSVARWALDHDVVGRNPYVLR